VPRSTIIVHVDVPLAGLAQELERKVPRRVAEERDHDIGAAGRLEYVVDRGPLSVNVEGESLAVVVPLHGHARACAKGRCYAGCDPELRSLVRVPLRLGADYKLHASEVRFDVTRGCELRTLGGLVRVDVTPVLRAALVQETPRVRASIDRELPDLAPRAAQLWSELAKPRVLPLGACVLAGAEEITQGAPSGTAAAARLRFGLLARPELRMQCGTAPPARPLPRLRDDPALGDAGDVHLGVVLSKDAPARAFAGAATVLDVGGARARIRSAAGDLATGLGLELGGEACGAVSVRADGAGWQSTGAVQLAGVSLEPGDAARVASAGLDPAAFARAVERLPVDVPLSADQLPTVLPALASGMADEHATVNIAVASSRPEAAGLRGPEIVAVVGLRGSLSIRLR